jgi:acetyltransferase
MAELELNPIFVNHEQAIVVDAKVVLDLEYKKQDRYDHMAIMPYPHRLENEQILKNGTSVLIRPSRPEDADMVQDFVRNLSDQSRYNRFMSSIKQLSQSVLVRFTQLDYDREMALIMVKHDTKTGDKLLGIARYVTDPDMEVCEFATSVADEWQGQGIASILMSQLFDVARDQGLVLMRGEILVSNTAMSKLMQKLGFTIRRDPDDNSIYIVEKPLYTENTTAPKTAKH